MISSEAMAMHTKSYNKTHAKAVHFALDFQYYTVKQNKRIFM